MVGHGGRGGKTGTLTHEQLQTLGCVGKDIPVVQLAPPPIYPPLITKPIKTETTPELEFQILCKENLLTRMRDSPNHLCVREPKRMGNNATKLTMGSTKLPLDKSTLKAKPKLWKYAPKEMHGALNRKRVKKASSKIAAKKVKTLDTRLKALEEKEKTESDTEGANKNNSDSEAENEDEEQAADDEMDDENDYGVSYFDNGESYNEEDDNLDDGPVY